MGIKNLGQLETMVSIEDEGDFQNKPSLVNVRSHLPNHFSGLPDEIVVEPLLDLPVEQRIVRRQRLEL